MNLAIINLLENHKDEIINHKGLKKNSDRIG